MCHKCQSSLSSVPTSHIITVFLWQVHGSFKPLGAHNAPVRGVMINWYQTTLCFNTMKTLLQKCSHLLPTWKAVRAGEILVFHCWVCWKGQSPLAASTRSHWSRPANWAADSSEHNNNSNNKQQQQKETLKQQINKKRIFLQLAQRPHLFQSCDCTISWCRDSVHNSRGGLGIGHQKLKYIYKYKSSTREIYSTVVIQCVTGMLYSISEMLAVLWHFCLKTQSRARFTKLPTLFLSQCNTFFMRLS